MNKLGLKVKKKKENALDFGIRRIRISDPKGQEEARRIRSALFEIPIVEVV